MAGLYRSVVMSIAGSTALAACVPAKAPQDAPAPESSRSFSREMSLADREACTTSGGRIERRGRIGAELCVRPFADAGKQCTDNAQCQGKCIGSSEQSASTVSGQCQADDRLFGCHSEISQGKAVNTICID